MLASASAELAAPLCAPAAAIPADGVEQSTTERFKALLKNYGPLALGLHLSIFWATWIAFAALIAAGVDLGSSGSGLFGLFAAAYLPTQITKPPRVLLTLALTPVVAKRLGRDPA